MVHSGVQQHDEAHYGTRKDIMRASERGNQLCSLKKHGKEADLFFYGCG